MSRKNATWRDNPKKNPSARRPRVRLPEETITRYNERGARDLAASYMMKTYTRVFHRNQTLLTAKKSQQLSNSINP